MACILVLVPASKDRSRVHSYFKLEVTRGSESLNDLPQVTQRRETVPAELGALSEKALPSLHPLHPACACVGGAPSSLLAPGTLLLSKSGVYLFPGLQSAPLLCQVEAVEARPAFKEFTAQGGFLCQLNLPRQPESSPGPDAASCFPYSPPQGW